MTLTENYIIVKDYLHDGLNVPINRKILQNEIKESPLMAGLLLINDLTFDCPSCGCSAAYLGQDGGQYFAFCTNLGPKNCGGKQAAASKARIVKEKCRETGAKKFAMGSTYQNAAFPQWITNSSNPKIVIDWINNDSPFLLVHGDVGTSKTYMCACILNYLFDQGKNVYYTNHRRFMSDLQNPMSEGKSSDEIMQRFMYQDILIFDDLGSGTNTDWQKEKILDLIDHRYSHNMKTVITTNFDRVKLKDYLGIRTISRIFDKKNTIFEVVGNDRRVEPEESW